MTTFSGSSLLSFLLETATAHGDRVAMICGEDSLTFDALAHEASGLAQIYARRGVSPGDRVFILAANGLSFGLAFWACQMVGAVVVPVHPDTQTDKLAWMIDDSTPALIVTDTPRLPRARSATLLARHQAQALAVTRGARAPLPARPAAWGDDLAAIIYTSGSTSAPKGVMLSHTNMVAAATSVSTYLHYSDKDRVYCAVPFTFDYGLHQITMTARVGATLLIARDFSQPIMNLHAIATSGATVVPLVPSMAALMMPFRGRFDLGAVRAVTNTAAALGARMIDDIAELFPKAALYSMYGLTECHRCTYLEPDQLAGRKLSVGKAIPFTSMWVVDDAGRRHSRAATGELVIRGETVMQGYWNNPEATAARLKRDPQSGEMVLHTGDQVRLDDEGYAYFVGRGDDILKIRGIKVAPAVVEQKLSTHPGVAQIAVIASPCPIAGARLTAFAEAARGSGLTAEGLQAWCHDRFEPHDRPADCRVMAALPKNQNGKIDRHILKSLCADQRDPVAS